MQKKKPAFIIAVRIMALLTILTPAICNGQHKIHVNGQVYSSTEKSPVPYATVLYSDTINNITAGTICDENGNFNLYAENTGSGILSFSSVGYKKTTIPVDALSPDTVNIGPVFLDEEMITMKAAIIEAEKILTEKQSDKSTYYINKKILSASGNTADVLRNLPGISVDLKHNIQLEGNSHILVLINGRERGSEYINQLNPSSIEKVEIIHTPPSEYEGDVAAVINIILKDNIPGFTGHIYAECPTSKTIVYLFNTCSFQYGYKKLTLYGAYDGGINYEDIDEITERVIGDAPKIISTQFVRQRNQLHTFSYGADYNISEHQKINFHGYYNPYSYEQNGLAEMQNAGNDSLLWSSERKENDKNRNLFSSIYYAHTFNEKGDNLSLDLTYATIKTENSINFISNYESLLNTNNSQQSIISVKADVKQFAKAQTSTAYGLHYKKNIITGSEFNYSTERFSAYASMKHQRGSFSFHTGVRPEFHNIKLSGESDESALSLFPYAIVSYKMQRKKEATISYRRSIKWPSAYQRYPYIVNDDPITTRKGNPLLRPEIHNKIYLEFAKGYNDNSISGQLFYHRRDNALGQLITLSRHNTFIVQHNNLGQINEFGLQSTSTFKSGRVIINTHCKLFIQQTEANLLARLYDINNRNNLVFETSLSTLLTLENGFSAAANLNYSSSKTNMQYSYSSDPLFMLSLEKSFTNGIKTGFTYALPFQRKFNYQSSSVTNPQFTTEYNGMLHLPLATVILRASYNFSLGKKHQRIKRQKEELERRNQKGL